MSLFLIAFSRTKTVIEEVPLPRNAVFFGDDFLPLANNFSHVAVARKRDQAVHMVGHEEEKMHEPITAVLTKLNCFEESVCND